MRNEGTRREYDTIQAAAPTRSSGMCGGYGYVESGGRCELVGAQQRVNSTTREARNRRETIGTRA